MSHSSDWVPQGWQKAGGSHEETQELAAQMLNETNKKFSELLTVEKVSVARKNNVMCAACDNPIDGRVLEAMDQTFHPDCFTCSQCAKPFEGSYSIVEGKPWCQKCIEWEKKENPNRKFGASSPRQTQGNSNANSFQSLANIATKKQLKPVSGDDDRKDLIDAQKKAHENLQMGKISCAACGEDIGTGLAVSMGDLTFHENCFICNACGQVIGANNNFVNQDGVPYHKQCHQDWNASKCAECHKPLVGKYVTASGRKLHKECFKCSGCGGDLSGGFAMRNDKPVCGTCVNNNVQPSVSVTVQSKGLRVDPRTGAKMFVDASNPAPKWTPPPEHPSSEASSAKAASPRGQGGNKFCTNCGTAVSAKFCSNCGNKV